MQLLSKLGTVRFFFFTLQFRLNIYFPIHKMDFFFPFRRDRSSEVTRDRHNHQCYTAMVKWNGMDSIDGIT